MERLNRILVVAMAALVIAAALIVLAAATGLWLPPDGWLAGAARTWLSPLAEGGGAALPVALSSLALVAATALIIAQRRPRDRASLIVSSCDEGRVSVTRATVRSFIAHIVGQIPDVRSATVSVEEAPAGLMIRCRVETNANAALDKLGERLRAEVRERLREQLQLEVSWIEVDARMRFDPRQRPVVK